MDDIKSVKIDLRVKERARVRGYGQTAEVEFELTHPEMKGSLRLICRRDKLEEELKRLGISAKRREEFNGPITPADVAYEAAKRSTGIPLSERGQKEFTSLMKGEMPEELQGPAFRIRIF